MTPERIGAQARPEHSGSSTIVSLSDMTATPPTDNGALHALVMHSLDEDQAQDVVSIPLEGKSSIADHMVIASGRSSRHVSAVADKLLQSLKTQGSGAVKVEGLAQADWVLIDAGDVIVHIFRPEVRSFYNLEKLWSPESPVERLAV